LTSEEEEEEQVEEIPVTEVKRGTVSGVEVLGVGDLLTRLAECCHPVPGDDIIGFITRSKGVSIHRKDCPNILNLKERVRLIDVNWGHISELHPIAVQISAWNRVGLLKDISTIVAAEKVNISNITLKENKDDVNLFVTLDVRDMDQLKHILSKISSIPGVINASRLRPQSKASV
jgi:GTP pyrophosphokinase